MAVQSLKKLESLHLPSFLAMHGHRKTVPSCCRQQGSAFLFCPSECHGPLLGVLAICCRRKQPLGSVQRHPGLGATAVPDAEVWRAAPKQLFQLELLAPTLMEEMPPRTSCWLQEPCECRAEREGCWGTYQRGTVSFALALDSGAVKHRIMEGGRWLFHQQGTMNMLGSCC